MNNRLINALAFVAGAAIGSFATWRFVKTKYERIAQEEIDSVKEVYSRRNAGYAGPNDADEAEKQDGPTPEQMTFQDYTGLIDNLGYDHRPDKDNEQKGGVNVNRNKPYVISPEQYEDGDYDKESLTYYADGVLEDDWGEVIKDVDDLVGVDSLKTFGDYEEDTVFVRNDRKQIDYEICRTTQTYSEATSRNAPRVDY
jgi:hypothetical protein